MNTHHQTTRKPSILILGGYGRAGTYTARLLLEQRSVSVTLAGRSLGEATAAAERLQTAFPEASVSGMGLDGNDFERLLATLPGFDLVIGCMPYRGDATDVMRAIAASGVDYVDISPAESKTGGVDEGLCRQRGQRIIVDAGAVPGLPLTLARFAATHLDRAKTIRIAVQFKEPDLPLAGAYDLVAHVEVPAMIYEKGQWKRVFSISRLRRINLPHPFSSEWAVPAYMQELERFPEIFPVSRLAMYVAGSNPLASAVLLVWKWFRLARSDQGIRRGAELFRWLNGRFTRRPHGLAMSLQAVGTKRAQPVRLTVNMWHPDTYAATAIPLVATVLQWMDGRLLGSGIQLMGDAVDPLLFIEQIRQLGMNVDVSVSATPED